MQKILVYLYDYYPCATANTNVMMPLIRALKQHFEVVVFTIDSQQNLPRQEDVDGIQVLRSRQDPGSFWSTVHRVYEAPLDGVTGRGKGIKRAIIKSMRKLCPKDKLKTSPSLQAYRQVLEQGEFSAVISVSDPVLAHFETLALAQEGVLANSGIRWFAYFTDPYAAYIGNRNDYSALAVREVEFYRCADVIFTSPEIYEDNKTRVFGDYLDKTIPIPFANLSPLPKGKDPGIFEDGKINCLYAGRLADLSVRNPEYFYKICSGCSSDFRFHIFCTTADKANLELKRKYIDGNDRFCWHDGISLEETCDLMNYADILINLGNKAANQTPSKVFDYMSAGKPIVNFYSLEADTAKKYLSAYPYKLNLFEESRAEQKNRAAFETFCRKYAKQKIAYADVAMLYPDLAEEQVAERFVEQVRQQMQKPVKKPDGCGEA